MVDRAKADVYMAKEEYHIEGNNAYQLGLGIRYKLGRTFNTEYEYAKSLVKEDEQEAWPAVLFVALMNAYGIDNEDLLTVGRQAEELSKRYCEEIESVATSKNEMQFEKRLVYYKKIT